MFRIRLHGRGGQGLKVAGRILGSAFFASGYEVQDAPRYGAERRGAPVFAYVRASRQAIHERGIIARPDLVVVADDTLLSLAAPAVLQGVGPRCVLLVHTQLPEAAWRERLKVRGPLYTIATAGDAARHAAAVCAGAAARIAGVVGRPALEAAIRTEVEPFGAAAVEAALSQVLAAYDACGSRAGAMHEAASPDAARYEPPHWVFVHPEPVDVAAPDVHAPGTSVRTPTGAWRTMRPVIDYARCNRCSWICGTHCPDSAITVDPDHTPRIDYDHCKGCLVCVSVCPPHAVSAIAESTGVPA